MLEFKKREAIRFGDIVAMPEPTNELRLRLRTASLTTDTDIAAAIDVLAAFFPKDEKEIKEFMKANMEAFELGQLQSYLLGGASALDIYEKQVEAGIQKVIEESK